MRKTHFSKTQKRKMRRGFLWIDYSIIDDKNLTSSDKIVYMVLARFVDNKTQECYPSNTLVAEMSGLTRMTVINSIQHLEENGYIEVDRSSGKVNYYQLNDTSKIILPVKNKTITSKKSDQPPVKNKTTNNTYINNTNNNILLSKFFDEKIGKVSELKEKEKFLNYWTESNGKKERWQREKVFDIKRRWQRWLMNALEWNKRQDPQLNEKEMTPKEIAKYARGF